jgi:hypothetical protein
MNNTTINLSETQNSFLLGLNIDANKKTAAEVLGEIDSKIVEIKENIKSIRDQEKLMEHDHRFYKAMGEISPFESPWTDKLAELRQSRLTLVEQSETLSNTRSNLMRSIKAVGEEALGKLQSITVMCL